MELAAAVRRRRMVRAFEPTPIPWEVVERLVKLAQHAPSAGFSQGFSVVAITDPETRTRVAELAGETWYTRVGHAPFLSTAPVQLVLCARTASYEERYREPDKARPAGWAQRWAVPFWHVDAGAALMLLLLGAVDAGLGAAFVGLHDPDALRPLLGIPEDVEPLGVMLLGHPAPDRRTLSSRRGRKPLDAVLHRERW